MSVSESPAEKYWRWPSGRRSIACAVRIAEDVLVDEAALALDVADHLALPVRERAAAFELDMSACRAPSVIERMPTT